MRGTVDGWMLYLWPRMASSVRQKFVVYGLKVASGGASSSPIPNKSDFESAFFDGHPAAFQWQESHEDTPEHDDLLQLLRVIGAIVSSQQEQGGLKPAER